MIAELYSLHSIQRLKSASRFPLNPKELISSSSLTAHLSDGSGDGLRDEVEDKDKGLKELDEEGTDSETISIMISLYHKKTKNFVSEHLI